MRCFSIVVGGWNRGILVSQVHRPPKGSRPEETFQCITLGSDMRRKDMFSTHVAVLDPMDSLPMGRGLMYHCRDFYESRPVYKVFSDDVSSQPVLHAEPCPTPADARGEQKYALVAFKPVVYGRASARVYGDVALRSCSMVGKVVREWACHKCGLEYSKGFFSNIGKVQRMYKMGWLHPPGYAIQKTVVRHHALASGMFDTDKPLGRVRIGLPRRSFPSDVEHSLFMVRKGEFFRVRIWVQFEHGQAQIPPRPLKEDSFWVWGGGDCLEKMDLDERLYWEVGVKGGLGEGSSASKAQADWLKAYVSNHREEATVYD